MAVIANLTPDSFSDGGAWLGTQGTSKLQAMLMRAVDDGALMIDVGAESTRPGAQQVSAEEEIARIVPFTAMLSELSLRAVLSIDTRRAQVAAFALANGFDVVNDVSGLADPEMAATVAAAGAGLIIGHLRGDPSSMLDNISFVRLLDEVSAELLISVERALAAGVARSSIAVDPGLGFGKTHEQSARLLVASREIEERLHVPVMIGASRKRFLGHATGNPDPAARDTVSAAAALLAAQNGAAFLRVHDVRGTSDALAIWRFVQTSARQGDGGALGLS